MNAYKLISQVGSFMMCGLLPSLPLQGQEKKVINEADDLPRIAYPFKGSVIKLIEDEARLKSFLDKMEADIREQLQTFDIRDKATVLGYISTLRTLDFLRGDYDAAREKIDRIRELHEKPSDKLTSGLIMNAIIEELQQADGLRKGEMEATFVENYRSKVKDLPWDVVQDTIESTNGSFQYISKNLYYGGLESQLQVAVDQTGEITLDQVRSLASIRLMIDHVLPRKEAIVEVTGDYIAANRVEKDDIWAARDVDLSGEENLTPVVVAIWDSGIDPEIFKSKGLMWTNKDEIPNGEDDDGNGFVDDIHGFGYDLDGFPTPEPLYPLTEEQAGIYPEQLDLVKGLLDLQAAVDSEEAAKTRERMSNLERDEYKPFVENLSLFSNYTHGTHVAGIAAKGNPAIRLLNARITFGYKLIPEEPTIEETTRSARNVEDVMAYFQEAGVRVVNLSWGGTQAGIESALQANGVGDSPEHRAGIARVLFEIGYDALVEGMKNNPDILFIPAAGNSDEDVDFNKVIPSSIDLPNVLVVGAVDSAGDETDFTSYGKNIRAHANGFEVESYVPGGRKLKFSGTSMSAPNAANLAAKLLALDPTLTPEEVIDLIRLGIEKTEDGRRYLLHPKRSIALLRVRNSM